MTQSAEQLSPVKRALLELRQLRSQLTDIKKAQSEPIAIIGTGLRFPGGVKNANSFWSLLNEGRDAIVPIPADRWDVEHYYDPDPDTPGKMYTRAGGFLNHVDQFDPHFFGISPREAAEMDPQQRLLLQISWEALEHAAQAPDRLQTSQTGVFIGLSGNDYLRKTTAVPETIDVYTITGGAFSVAAGRISYLLGLQGPSLVVDTACSSSLVAVHLACQSLRNRESDMALAGGVGLILSPEASINFSKAGMLARDDRCKTFDARADGYVRGEGGAIIVLKRLSDALVDGDNILALVRGSAINQDGRSSGLTAPNGPSQEAVIRQALANANLQPAQIQYIEAHGTGTSLGDPIEVQALHAVLGADRSQTQPLAIGSVKTNFGHLEAAAGIAGLLKTALALHHQAIPPHLHLQEHNPLIAWETMPLTIPTALTPWPETDEPRRAGVSSFGFSGTNAHVILEEAPTLPPRSEVGIRPYHLLTLSAHTDASLQSLVANYESYLANTTAPLGDIAYTTNIGRAQLDKRLTVVAKSVDDARARLRAWAQDDEPEDVASGQVIPGQAAEIAFLFTGHGAQYPQMGQQLFKTAPIYREAIAACAEVAAPYLDQPLQTILFPQTEPEHDLMKQMRYAQPALFAVEYALARLWQSWGVTPTAVMGHSLGEYVAACIAGVFSLEDGIKLVCARGRLMDSLPEMGKMAVVYTSEAEAARFMASYGDRLAIGVVNGPELLVLSGDATAVDEVVAAMDDQGIKTRSLAVSQAAHSPLLDPILDEFESVAAEASYHPPHIALISCTTGKIASPEEVTNARYWRRHLRQPVRFADAVDTLYQEGFTTFLEIGPHPALAGMAQRCWPPTLDQDLPTKASVWQISLHKEHDDWQMLLENIGALHVNGVAIDWPALAANGAAQAPYRRCPLPTNPWQESRYWFETATPSTTVSPDAVWQTAVTAGTHQQTHGPLNLHPESYKAKWQALAQLSIAYIRQAFVQMGLFLERGDTQDAQSIIDEIGVQPHYAGLLTRWLNHLTNEGELTQQNGRYTNSAPLTLLPLTPLITVAQEALTDIPALLNYVQRCGENLAAILTGKVSPLDTIFPEGTYETADFLYNYWPLVQYYNNIAAQVMGALANAAPAEKQIRVLEIGAGTGGTTASLLPMLPAHQTRYTFTDVSDLFLGRAEARFQEYPFLAFDTLNIEKSPTAQGFSAHSYDVIVAANVLHATSNLDETLRHVRDLLAPGGLLILFEVTTHFTWFDITTGLIEGWELYADGWRADNPLLSAATWRQAIEAAGFAQIHILPEADALPVDLGSNIIVAQTAVSENDKYHIFGGTVSAIMAAEITTVTNIETDRGNSPSFREEWQNALPDEQEEMLLTFVRRQVGRILRLPANHIIDQHRRLMDLGVDSLMAVELRNRLQKGLGRKEPIPATLIFDYPTISAVVSYLQELLTSDAQNDDLPTSDIGEPAVSSNDSESELQHLTDDEVASLLLRKLDDL